MVDEAASLRCRRPNARGQAANLGVDKMWNGARGVFEEARRLSRRSEAPGETEAVGDRPPWLKSSRKSKARRAFGWPSEALVAQPDRRVDIIFDFLFFWS
jgi:hypothetical protein